MFICVIMTCRLHFRGAFDRMPVMVRMSQVRSLFKLCIKGIVFLLIIIFVNFIKFSVEARVLALVK